MDEINTTSPRSMEVESKQHLENLEEMQAVRFAKDFSRVYKAEKQKRIFLERVNLELEKRNEELMDFAFLASNDLKEPLAKMDKFIGEFIEEPLQAGETGLLCANNIRASAKRLHQLIDEIGKFYRINSVLVHYKPTNLSEILSENLSDLETLIESSGVEIAIDELPVLETDPIQVRVLFQNLLSNVIRFHDRKLGCPLKITAEETDEGSWRIIIKGSGEGFEMEKMRKILSPDFNEEERFEIDKEEMGLSLCKRIVRRLGGKMYEENVHNSFSFNIIFPGKILRHSYHRVIAK